MNNISLKEKYNTNFSGSHDVIKQVEDLKNKYLSLWWETKSDFPRLKEKIDFFHKLSNERKVDNFRKELYKELKGIPQNEGKMDEWSKNILFIIKQLENKIVGNEESTIDFFAEKGYSHVTEEFIKEVGEFDSTMDVYDIFQAIRNVWIMNSIQILFDMEVMLTPSIFSYSMLYPYSDNYLDDNDVSIQDKEKFNNKFRKWLSGDYIEASNSNEKHIFQLVKRIEGEFSREKYSSVFESLLSIHNAQEKSLIQQKGRSAPYERNIIDIAFEKGGTSVLADGYLVKGELSKDEADFMFGYGVFLQLIDDLQDVQEDLKNGHMTIFSQIAGRWPLDNLTNKLFWFIEKALDDKYIFETDDSVKVRKVIYESCVGMMFEAISKNRKLFSRKYVKEIEEYSMLRFSYYKKLKRKFEKDYSSDDIYNICMALDKYNVLTI